MLVALWFALQEDPWGAGRCHGDVGAPGGGGPWRWVPLEMGAFATQRCRTDWDKPPRCKRRGLAALGPLAGASWQNNPTSNVNTMKKQQPPKIPPPAPLNQLNVSSYYIKIHFSKYSKSSYEIHGRLVSFPYKKACAQRRRQRKARLLLLKHNQILQFVTKACIPCCRWKESRGPWRLVPRASSQLGCPHPILGVRSKGTPVLCVGDWGGCWGKGSRLGGG